MKHLFKIFCLVNLVLLFCCTTSTPAQHGYYLMLCRGGRGAYRIDDVGKGQQLKIGISIKPSSRAAGRDPWQLEPGTCSWLDRTLSENEPHQIQINYLKPSGIEAIRKVLSSPLSFWSFRVRLSEGYFQAADSGNAYGMYTRDYEAKERHNGAEQTSIAGAVKKPVVLGKLKSREELREDAINEDLNLPLAPFFSYNKVNTEVEQDRSAVTFSFETRESSSYFIEVSKHPPIASAPVRILPGNTLVGAFSPGTTLTAVTNRDRSRFATNQRVIVRPKNGGVFEAYTTYHYVVTAKVPDGTYWRHVGKFRTGN